MPSLFPGYEYDIFISYRHKDNLPTPGFGRQANDGWVSEFVENLRKELEATFKEDVSIYFDENPHDGLLETYHVDKSLEGKLRCLIFIPIISQTYCDPKSFAWKHEFCAFNKIAKEDQFGKEVKLLNGNVASRVLPVKIHGLEVEDQKILEGELEGKLRSIDFIYHLAGVNRPLRPKDDELHDNHYKTIYRNQINKTANAIKELITGLKNYQQATTVMPYKAERAQIHIKSITRRHKSLISIFFLIAAFIACYMWFFAGDRPDAVNDKSIAVLPFVDMSAQKDQEYLGDGIANEIINSIAQLKELKVIGRTSSFQFKGEKVDLREVGKKLNVSRVLEGSVQKEGNLLRIHAELINVADGSQIWSEQFNEKAENIFSIQERIAQNIIQKLKVNELNNLAGSKEILTTNTQSYEYFLKAKFFHYSRFIEDYSETDFRQARLFYKESIKLDSGFALAYAGLSDLYDDYSDVYTNRDSIIAFKTSLIEKAFVLNPKSGFVNFARGYSFEGGTFTDVLKRYKSFVMAYELSPNDPLILQRGMGLYLSTNGFHKYGLRFLETALELDPLSAYCHQLIGFNYLSMGRLEESMDHLTKAIELEPNHIRAIVMLGHLHLIKKEFNKAEIQLNTAANLNPSLNDLSAMLGLYYALKGNKAEATAKLAKVMNHWDHVTKLQTLSILNEKMKLKEWLNDIYLNKKVLRYTYNIANDPLLGNLRNDPDLMALINKIITQQNEGLKEIIKQEEERESI